MQISGYDLSRDWFNWCFEHPDLVSPNHTALYFFAIEHCNRLGWKPKFGFPTEMAKDALGIKSYRTYINTLNDLVEWGFIKMVERSKNQYSANVIALVKNAKANAKALAKATQKHVSKQGQSTGESKASIDKPITLEPINQLTREQGNYRAFGHLFLKFKDFDMLIVEGWTKEQIDHILDKIENYKDNKKYNSLLLTARNWLRREHDPKTQKNGKQTGHSQESDAFTMAASTFTRVKQMRNKNNGPGDSVGQHEHRDAG